MSWLRVRVLSSSAFAVALALRVVVVVTLWRQRPSVCLPHNLARASPLMTRARRTPT
jgi:hypothetical protein